MTDDETLLVISFRYRAEKQKCLLSLHGSNSHAQILHGQNWELFNIWKKEMTSKVKMCEEVLSISLQFYLGLGNPTVLEVDHASPAKGSPVIVSFKGST